MKVLNPFWPDKLRVLATISMILLHVTSPILYKYGKIGNSIWMTGNIIDSAVRFCVPVFVMLSGALLLNKDYSIKEFIRRRVVRVVLPFMFYSIIYVLYDLYRVKVRHTVFTFDFFKQRLVVGAEYHLWYVYMIIGLYLFIPVIAKWIRASEGAEIKYFLAIWLTTLVIAHPVFHNNVPKIELSYFSGFLGYLVLGFYLSRIRLTDTWKKYYSYLLLFVGIGITVLGTAFYTERKGAFVPLFYGFLTPNVLLTSIGVFMIVTNKVSGSPLKNGVRSFICKYSYGIYLVHVLVLAELNRAGLNCFYIHPSVGIILTTFACLALSALIIYSINKLPLGKYISG